MSKETLAVTSADDTETEYQSGFFLRASWVSAGQRNVLEFYGIPDPFHGNGGSLGFCSKPGGKISGATEHYNAARFSSDSTAPRVDNHLRGQLNILRQALLKKAIVS